MFGHIQALRLNNLQVNPEQAIKNFSRIYNLTEDELPFDTAKSAYYRMLKDVNESEKTDGDTA